MGDILLRNATFDQVTIVNQTDRTVAYLMTVVPRALIKAAMVPWKQIVAELGQSSRWNGILSKFASLLK